MGTPTPTPATGGPFVGRRAELGELAARIAETDDGAGGLVLVAGPAGIGKTRTVEEAVAGVPGPVVWGRCVDDPGAPPLWPWRRVLRELPAVRAAAAGALAEVDRVLESGGDPDAARFRLAAATTDALVECADAGGLVVVLEDLHWADESSLRLLRHLAGDLPRSRLLVVGTHRDAAGPDSPLAAALPDLLRGPATRTLRLAPLTEDDVRAYLPAGDADAVRAVHRRSGGIPLYLRAVARAPAAPGSADGHGELRALVRTTLTALPPAALDLLDAAAVLGEEIDAGLLTAVTGHPAPDVATGLDAAVDAGVLAAVPDSPGRRRFAHAVVRDAVYDDLSPSVREELHRRAAEALEQRAASDDTAAGLVAGHWLRASSGRDALRRAAGWARRAAVTATRLLAFDDAARFLATALAAAQRAGADDEERAGLLVHLATAEYRAGRLGEALEHALAASDAAAAAGRGDLLAAAALSVHDVNAPAFPPALLRMSERALATLDETASPELRSRLLSQAASALADSGRLGVAAGHATEALALARRSGSPDAVIDAVRARMKAAPTALEVDERLDLGRLAIEHAAASGQPLAELWGAKWRIDAGLEVGDMDVVRDELDRVSALAASTRLPLVRWHDRRLRASIAALLGRFPEAIDLNEEARVIGLTELAGDLSLVGLSGAFGMQHALVTGSLTGWDGRAVETLERAGDIPIVIVTRALVDMVEGRREEAAVRYVEIRRLMTDPDFVASSGVALNLVPLVEAFGDAEAAGLLHEQLAPRPLVASGAGVYGQGSWQSLLGRLAVLCGRLDEAVDRFTEALAVDSRIGARPATVLDGVGLAEALLDRGNPHDLPRAGELARSAAAEARRMGMPAPERRAAALADRAGRAARAADPLTAREREIATLVARAWTNRRIAEELVLSERTVESHVRNVLAKLGAANRTELATLIARS